MGKRGPTKKPTELKLIQGNPGKNALPCEPKPQKVRCVEPPKKLSAAERRAWKEIAPKLEANGLLTEIDLNMLVRYCRYAVKFDVAQKFIDEHGFEFTTYQAQTPEQVANGEPKVIRYVGQYPAVNTWLNLGDKLLRIEQQFGMSPSARASINVAPKHTSEKDDIKKFLYGP